jgi:hypothetical protein
MTGHLELNDTHNSRDMHSLFVADSPRANENVSRTYSKKWTNANRAQLNHV